jgi:hypothetical protein
MGYLARFGRALIGEPLTLPERIAREYPELMGLRLRRGGLPPRIGGWMLGQATVAAITLRRTIFFGTHASLDAALLLHEFRHAEQFLERRSFPVRYIWESLRRGYHQNRYEIDARTYAARRLVKTARIPPAEEA